MTQLKKICKYILIGAGGLFVLVIIIGLVTDNSKNGKTNAQVETAEVPKLELPSSQIGFIEIVQKAQKDAANAENEMAVGGVKFKREKELCGFIKEQGPSAKDWIGKVEDIGANGDGKGVISLTLEDDIFVKTWNNDVSDYSDKTLINPDSDLFAKASALKTGHQVKFSGTFFKGNSGDCLKEGSMTLNGKIKKPEFIFRFSKIEAI